MRGRALLAVLVVSFLWSPIATARPSFDCRKATSHDEFVICRTPELAELDNRIAAAYAHLRTTRGRSFADEVKIPLWRRRQACRSDALCIKERQIEALNAYRAAGAPVPSEATGAPLKESAIPETPQNKAESKPAQPPSNSGPNVASQQPAGAPSPEAQPNAGPGRQEAKPHSVTSGTGIFIAPDGYVLTNAQVVKDCLEIRVGADQGNSEVGRFVAKDTTNDLALLKVNAKPSRVRALRFGVRLGENVEAFADQIPATSGNLTTGTVTALAGIAEDSRYLQVSAAIRPGSSGGPLLDENGNVVGIVSPETLSPSLELPETSRKM